MKLVTYARGSESRLGIISGDWIVDAAAALALYAAPGCARPEIEPAARVVSEWAAPPSEMVDFLRRGETYRDAAGTLVEHLARAIAAKADYTGLFTPLASARLRAPIARPGKITCLGLNYADHAREQGGEPPAAPIYFLKSANTICGPGDPIRLPPNSTKVDYEAEFAAVIGKGGRGIPIERAYEHVAGYMILDDVSARDFQFGDKQWFRGKSCDTFAPTGPWLLTRDEVPDPHRLRISLTLNGQTMQDSSTSQLIFKVDYLVSYLSQSVTWEVGDIISTGTPPGVGVFRKPPVFLKPGDTVSVTVEGLGTLTNPVVGPGA